MALLTSNNIDTRILEADYRNFHLVARYWNGQYRGCIWKNHERVAGYEGNNLDIILENLIGIVDQIRGRSFEKRGHSRLTEQDYIDAWGQVLPRLKPCQLKLLERHCEAKGFALAREEMMSASGLHTVDAIMKEYEDITHRLQDELLWDLYRNAEEPLALFETAAVSPAECLTLDAKLAKACRTALDQYQKNISHLVHASY